MLTILLVSAADTELLAAAASGAGYLTANPARTAPGDVPALIHDPVANGDPDTAARVVLGGDGPMPDFDVQLTDAQIAAVLSYVRTSFGNSAGPVSPSVVANARNAMAHGQ